MFRLSKVRREIVCSAVLLLCTAPLAFGQVQTGGIEGVVTDATNAAVPGAAVTITDTDTNIVRQLTTDGQGRYAATR